MQPGEESIFDRSTVSAASSAPALPKLYRGRPWLAALAAVLTELVVIGGVDNQGVTKTLRNPLNDPSRVVADYSRGAIDAATTFWWRFAPANGQPTHVWAAQFAAIGALVVLTWLGVLAVARGSVTFGRVWIATWAVVAAVAPVAIMVRNVLVTPTAPGPAQSRIGQSVYGFDAFGPVIVAGLVLGLVAGLVTAAAAVSSRRQVAAAAPVRGSGEQDEYYDDSFSPRYSSPPVYEPRPWGEPQWERPAQEATTQLPRYTADDQAARYAPDDQPTVATPVPAWPAAPESVPAPERGVGVPEPAAAPAPSAEPAPSAQPEPSAQQSVPEVAGAPEPSAQVWRPDEPAATSASETGPVPPQLRRELQREPDVDTTQAIPVQPQSDVETTQAIPVQRAEREEAAEGERPAEPPASGGRELADEDELADELAVEEHTQELPRITDEPEQPNR
ncbi:MAG TPA: hypothetical protein VFT67_13995 [Jatrophihabitantaceae bacterium]|nr:hypothetical protein [Jatrophihabitantaceae bacterium]